MVRAVGLLVLLVLLQLIFGGLHLGDFLARQVAPPVRRPPAKPPDVYRPSPAVKGVSVQNPLLKDPHGDINRQLFESPLDSPVKSLPAR